MMKWNDKTNFQISDETKEHQDKQEILSLNQKP